LTPIDIAGRDSETQDTGLNDRARVGGKEEKGGITYVALVQADNDSGALFRHRDGW